MTARTNDEVNGLFKVLSTKLGHKSESAMSIGGDCCIGRKETTFRFELEFSMKPNRMDRSKGYIHGSFVRMFDKMSKKNIRPFLKTRSQPSSNAGGGRKTVSLGRFGFRQTRHPVELFCLRFIRCSSSKRELILVRFPRGKVRGIRRK